MKIIDKINDLGNNIFYSFEYFPPKTSNGLQNLYLKIEKMGRLEPLFADVTWGAGGTTSELTLDICKNLQNIVCLETQMHLTCTNMKKDRFITALDEAKNNNIRNILALRGDPPKGSKNWNPADHEFSYAKDLVKFIKEKYGDYFNITVAGYPEGHPDGNSYEEDLMYLKEKIDAGADMIITQLFYDVNLFIKFCDDCKKLGIICPILPGIMPIFNYNSFKRMTGFCKTSVPKNILDDLELIKNDDDKVVEYGIQLTINMCKELIEKGINGLHFYTLNRDGPFERILNELGLIKELSTKRELPFKARIDTQESVRPIFWANNMDKYIKRTEKWNKYPNGRWGDSDNCAFGDIKDYCSFKIHIGTKKKKKSIWGDKIECLDDVINVFKNFLEKKIKFIPWSDNVLEETDKIIPDLLNINSKGYLTINSQPKLNGVKSNSKNGWGGDNGYIYQKSYLELFTNKNNLDKLLNKMDENITFCAINNKGDLISNCNDDAIALTWGVFPNKEIVQPTIAKKDIFIKWKEDAFKIWIEEWGFIYDDDKSFNFLKSIMDNYYLVFIIDNNYIDGNIFRLF
jgi:methylenetetrahydrofolate reductase (NADPH)